MKAWVLERIARVENKPLILKDIGKPEPRGREILIRISTCGICRTELDEIEGRKIPKLPVVLGHEVVGFVEKVGERARRFKIGDRVGVGWIYDACGKCKFCLEGKENLCDSFLATGCDADGGYAEYMVVKEDSAYPIPDVFGDAEASPLLCAGAIGYRALKLTSMRDRQTIALYGFGASGHLVMQMVRFLYPNSKIFVFTKKKGDEPSRLAKRLGADWVGTTGETPPERFDCAIDTTPVGEVVKEALKNLEKGGRLVINAIRKETKITDINYAEHLWNEKEIKSVANITRKDIEDFLNLAAHMRIKPEIKIFKFEEANEALISLKHGKYRGAGVLKI
ncbi:MAG: zinc-dependent alcohol dehydrogenase family protein [Thermoplasmata archaeon]|nr:zinc-dependent alcohol dehydrogenase family protein [Thermoplasmata archaeon]